MVFGSTPDLYSLNPNNILLPVVTTQNIPDLRPGEAKLFSVENHWPKDSQENLISSTGNAGAGILGWVGLGVHF